MSDTNSCKRVNALNTIFRVNFHSHLLIGFREGASVWTYDVPFELSVSKAQKLIRP